jgi:hypothetical protein
VEIANIKRIHRISAIVVLVAFLDLLLLLISGPSKISRIAPRNPALTLVADGILIGIGIVIQIWLRDKPQYRSLRLLVYALTLAICLAVGLVIANLFLATLHRS